MCYEDFNRAQNPASVSGFRLGVLAVHGHYIGYKLMLAVDDPSLKPLAILMHRGSPHNSPLFDEILHKLKRRQIKRPENLIVCDKGYYHTCITLMES